MKRHGEFSARILTTLVIASVFSLCLHAQDDGPAAQLQRLEREIATINKTINSLDSERQSTVRTLEQIRLRKNLHQKEIDRHKLQINESDKKIVEIEATIKENRQYIGEHEVQVGRILRKMFTRGRMNFLKSLLSVSSTRDVGLAHTYLTYLAGNDIKAIRAYKDVVDKLEENQDRLERQKDRLAGLIEEEQHHVEEADKAAAEQNQLLRRIRTEKNLQQRSLQEKLRAKQELLDLIKRLEDAKKEEEKTGIPADRQFGVLRGRLPWPVSGRVIQQFGRIVDSVHNVAIENDGIEISANNGTPVLAVAPGKVVFAEWHDAGGNLVVIDHGSGYYTLYAHLSRFDVPTGTRVVAGQPIGAVGETGSLKGPLLRFEIRQVTKDGEQRALDPIRWLQRRRLR